MNQFRRVQIYGGFALALAMAMGWQQASGARAESEWQAALAAPMHLVRPYLQPNSDYSSGHRGVDYEVELGQVIYSPTEAEVRFNQLLVDRPVLSLTTDSGDLLEFEPACGLYPVGTRVSSGQPIGKVCPAKANYRQHCSQVKCLHFSLRTERGYLSPMVRYGALAPSVLLPHL